MPAPTGEPPPPTPTRKRSLWLGGALVAVAAAIGAATLLRDRGDAGEAVRTAAVERRDVTQKVLAQGKVRARTQVEVASEIGGRVATVSVKVGDIVKEGDPLFALDDEQLRNAVEQLRVGLAGGEAMLKRAELGVAEAQRGIERDLKLKEKGVVADEQLRLDDAKAQLANADRDQARAGVERTRLDLQRARDALRRARVSAPIAGTVVAVGVEVGQVVSAVQGLTAGGDGLSPFALGSASTGPSAPVVIADLAELIVKLDVDELDVGLVKEGQRATVRAQGIKDLAFDGVVERVGLMGRDQAGAVLFVVEVGVKGVRRDVPRRDVGKSSPSPKLNGEPVAVDAGAAADPAAADPATADPAAADPANPANAAAGEKAADLPDPRDVLRPGMSAQADIEVQHLDAVLAVPVAAVLEGDGGDKPDRVFVYDGDDRAGSVKEIVVKLGPTEGDHIAILAGLEEKQRVVEGPFRALKGLEDGSRVTIEKKDPSGADNNSNKKAQAKSTP